MLNICKISFPHKPSVSCQQAEVFTVVNNPYLNALNANFTH